MDARIALVKSSEHLHRNGRYRAHRLSKKQAMRSDDIIDGTTIKDEDSFV
jgi:hypothetical protein